MVSALGGAERQLATTRAERGNGLSWSPDGKLLAMIDRESNEDPNSIYLLSLESGESRRLTTPPRGHNGDELPRFSPDGRSLVFVRERTTSLSDIYLVSVEGGEPRRLTTGNHFTAGLDWTSDGRSIVFSANRSGRAGFFSLWRVSVTGGDPEALEIGDQGQWPTLSRQENRLSYAKFDTTFDIWRVGGPAAPPEDRSAARFISSTGYDYMHEYSPDGRKIAFTSNRSGYHEIWSCDSDGSNPRQLTFLEDPHTMAGRWSPDGQQIAFMSPKEGNYGIYVASVTGGFPRRLTTEDSDDIAPSWSSDGRSVYFGSNRSGRSELYRMSMEGGEAVQLTTNGGTIASESPDGRFVYFAKGNPPRGDSSGIWRMPVGGGEEVQVIERVEMLLWQLVEQGIWYLNRRSVPPAVEFYDFATGQVRQSAVLEKRLLFITLIRNPPR